jgi:phage-related protein
MSFLYDRDQNVTGTIPSSFTFVPSYGTQVSFSCEIADYTTVDNYLYTMPKAVNHLQMAISMPFESRRQEEARRIASFFESLHGTGYFQYTDPAQIYKPVNLFLNSLDNSYVENDLYALNATLSTDQISTVLNWNQPLITGSNIKGNWATSTSYQKYDIVRYTGDATFPSNTGNLYDSFYYCKESHTSQSSITPASVDTIKWSKDFFFQPTYSTPLSKETAVIKTELPYSFTKRTNFGLHANALKSFRLDFKGVSDAEARCILHFLIGRQGYKRFQYKIPTIYNQFKVFFAPQWTHTFVYKNVNDISVTLVEDPLGRASEDITSISTNGLVLYLEASGTSSYRTGDSWYDLSGSGNTATIYNTPVYSSRNRGIFVLDAVDDYVDFSVSGLTSTATIEVWAKINALGGMIMGWLRYDIYTIGATGIGFNTANSDLYGVPFAQVTSLGCIGNWKHYVFEMRSDVSYTNNKIYINGQQQTLSQIVTAESAAQRNFNSGVGRISGWRADSGYKMNMDLGAFRIYNRALTQEEITINFNAGRDRFKI